MTNKQLLIDVFESFGAHKYHTTALDGYAFLRSDYNFTALILTMTAARRLHFDWLFETVAKLAPVDDMSNAERYVFDLQFLHAGDLEEMERIALHESHVAAWPAPEKVMADFHFAQMCHTLYGSTLKTVLILKAVSASKVDRLEVSAAAHEFAVCGEDLSFDTDIFNGSREIAKMAQASLVDSQYANALFLCEAGLATCPKYVSETDEDIIAIRTIRAEVYRKLGRLDEAQNANENLLSFFEAESMNTDDSYREVQNNLAHVLLAQGRADAALDMAHKLLTAEERAPRCFKWVA